MGWLDSANAAQAGQASVMKNGCSVIWDHGAYLGSDYSATALRRIGEDTAAAITQQQHRQPLAV